MAQKSYFFNSAPGDRRTYQAADFARYFGSVLTSGIMPNPETGDIAALTPGEYGLNTRMYANLVLGLQVVMGNAIIRGYRYELDSPHDIMFRPQSSGDVGYDRIDRIVLRLDLSSHKRNIELKVIEGNTAINPEPPALTRDYNIFDLSLARVRVRAGYSYIDESDVVDERADETVCGFANSLITVPTSVFQQQFDAWFSAYKQTHQTDAENWLDDLKAQISQDTEIFVQQEILENSNTIAGQLMRKADEADYKATNAVNTANGIDGKATLAVDKSNHATLTAADAQAKASATAQQLETLVVQNGTSDAELLLSRTNSETGEEFYSVPQRLDSRKILTDGGKSDTTGGFLSFGDDDGHSTVYTTLAPLYESEGVRFSFGIVKNWVGLSERMDITRIKELESRGHEVASHSETHENYFDELNDAEIDAEMRNSVNWLRLQGLNVENFFLPFGRYNRKVKEIAKKYYRSMRTSANGAYRANIAPIETYELKTLWLGEGHGIVDDVSGFTTDTFEYYKYYIDKAHDEKSWLIISTHAPNIAYNLNYKDLLLQVVQYAKTKLKILTVRDVLNHYENTVEIGNYNRNDKTQPHFVVAHDGTIKTDGYPIKASKDNSVTNTTPITAFGENTITITKMTNAHATANGFPFTRGGHLYTHRLAQKGEDNVFDYQLMITLNGEIWKRTHSTNMSAGFNAWMELTKQYSFVLARDSIDNTALPNTFKAGVTVCELSSAKINSSNIPSTRGGTLTTTRGDVGELTTQTFVDFSGATFTRGAVENVWRDWVNHNPVQYTHMSEIDADSCNDVFSKFKIGVTYSPISSANANSSPTGVGGTLITYKPVNATEYGWQEYHVVNGGKYKRNFLTTTTFDAWQPLVNV